MAYAFGILWLFAQQQEKNIARIIDEAANNAAHIVARAIAEQVGVLETLSSSKFLDNGGFGDFRETAKRAWDMHAEWRTAIIWGSPWPMVLLKSTAENFLPMQESENSIWMVHVRKNTPRVER